MRENGLTRPWLCVTQKLRGAKFVLKLLHTDTMIPVASALGAGIDALNHAGQRIVPCWDELEDTRRVIGQVWRTETFRGATQGQLWMRWAAWMNEHGDGVQQERLARCDSELASEPDVQIRCRRYRIPKTD